MPIGTDIEIAWEYVSKYKSEHPEWQNERDQGGYPYSPEIEEERVHSYFRVYMGEYRTLFIIDTAVMSFWLFNEDGKLMELIVRKYYDSI